MATSVLVLKTLFTILTCVMIAALCYALAMDGLSSCFDPHARWTQVATADILIEFFFIWVWYYYKEPSWIKRVVFAFIILWCGSAVTCGYIVTQLFKLSPAESSKHPLYFVLVNHQKGDNTGLSRRASVVTAKIIYATLGCLMLGLLIYTLIVEGFPFHAEVLSPCMIATITDICIHAVVFSVWLAYKESSWINAFFWILSLVCFGSITMCAYIVRELFYLAPEQPVSFILFSKRDLMSANPLLMEYSSV